MNNNKTLLDTDHLDFDNLDDMKAPGQAQLEKVEASFNDLPTVLDQIVQNMKAQQDKLDEQATLLHPHQEIEDDNHLKIARSDVRDVKKVLNELKETRLNTTRPLDAFKKELIQVEKDISDNLSSEIDRVKELCDTYEVEQERNRQEERRKVKRKLAIERLEIRTKAEISQAIAQRINEKCNHLDESIQNNVLNWSLSDFDKNLNSLKSLKPKFPAADWNRCFGVHPSQDETQFVTIDDCKDILIRVKNEESLSYELAQARYETSGRDVINRHLVKMDEYKEEVAAIEKKEKENKAEALKLSEARRYRIEKEAEARRKKSKREAEARAEEAQRKRKLEESEAQVNAMVEEQEIGGKEINSRLVKAAASPTGYMNLLKYYIKSGGDPDKLKFLITHAIRNGRPQVDGVTYNV